MTLAQKLRECKTGNDMMLHWKNPFPVIRRHFFEKFSFNIKWY